MNFNLLEENNAYIFGLLQTDGHVSENTRNRSRISIELSKKDEDIIKKISSILPIKSHISFRNRITNFSYKKEYKSITLNIHNYEFKEHLKSLGFPVGKKSDIIEPPKTEFSEIGYYRGIIDGDGSLGITANGFPFFSLVTASTGLAEAYNNLIYRICGQIKKLNRNKRDNVYNICIYKESAQILARYLYPENCLGLNRKINKAKEVLLWERPATMKRKTNPLPCLPNHTFSQSLD